jgi:predicted alpha-1,2-mannosidase
VQTFLAFYKTAGQLPIWALAGGDTYQMLGLHAIAIIADCYHKGIRNYDAQLAWQAIKTTAMRDTTGFSMRYFVGLKNYKQYGYVPADLEMESVARTLEYAYNDWNIAQMARMLGKTDEYKYFLNRSASYRNVFDPATKLMRGRLSDGSWRTPFDPFASNHRRDDYCEGNAWQWTFFVPHDVQGLATLMGGKNYLLQRLDSLFNLPSTITGEHASGDITGLIGQYAHGNEPSHHTAYMFACLGQAWKTQRYVSKILRQLYDNTPEGICGNDDTGQMSAWYVMSSLGFYPVRHGDGTYVIGSPQFSRATLQLPNGKQLVIRTNGISSENIYVQSVRWNGSPYEKAFLLHEQLMQGGELVFEMGATPNPSWGSAPEHWQPSMMHEHWQTITK